MTAKDIAEVLAIFHQIADAPLSAFKDPAFVGRLQAECFIKGMPLKTALSRIDLEITEEAL